MPHATTIGPRVRRGRRRRRLRAVSSLLIATAVVLALYPDLTGVYTWFEQRQMLSALNRGFTAAERRMRPGGTRPQRADDPWEGWQTEDAAYWKRLKDGGTFGRLVIPRLGLDVAMVKGVRKQDLKLGPGWAPRTALPGPTGNVGISGHRTTYLAPFRNIDRMRRGDLIILQSPFRVYTYKVVDQAIVRPDAMGVWAPTRRPLVTLTACHPPYSAARRIVTRGVLVKVERRPAGDAGRPSR